MLTKVDLSPDYEEVLQQILENTENIQKLAGELGVEASGGEEGE